MGNWLWSWRQPARQRQEEQEERRGHGGEGEVEREEGREGQNAQEGEGDGEREMERERQDVREDEGEVEFQAEEPAKLEKVPQQPVGHIEYSLSPEQLSKPIESQVEFTESYLEPAKHHFHDIDQEYKKALEKRTEIDNLLKKFKNELKLQANADFPTCFQQLREKVGDYEQLELSSEEPLRIILGEEAEEAEGNGAQGAVNTFNSMLEKCREFPAEVEAATAHIKEKIQAVEKEHTQIEKTITALDKSKAFLEQIRTFGKEIDKLVGDVKWARGYLISKRVVTGIIQINPEP